MIFINFKTYEIGTGEKAKLFVQDVEKLVMDIGVNVSVLAQALDIRMLSQSSSIPIWGQHLDDIPDYGKSTGGVMPKAMIEAGAKGSMINHTEHKILPKDVRSIIQNYQSNTFNILLSSRTPEEVIKLDAESPTFLSYEPSIYIGMKTCILDVSPDLVVNLLNTVKSPLVVGAGIHKPEHIIKGLQLGVKGFLISSDVLLAPNPIERLKEYMIAYKSVVG